jgi:hopanoid biosynthesis associated protein HpnK
VRRLIVNADDFGLTSGVNRAIVEANRSGIVRSATLMANSQAFAEAVEFAGQCPQLGIGCHIVLIDGVPICNDVSSLTKGSGRFRTNLKDFALAAVRKKISAAEIKQEAEAQIRKIQSCGIAITHVDTHKHTHLVPHVLRSVIKAAKACGLRAIRNPFELRRSRVSRIAGTKTQWMRSAGVMAFQVFAPQFRKIMREEKMVTTDGTLGITVTGQLDQKVLTGILQAMPEGTWELVCHPGYCDADLRNAGTRLLESRQIELQALTSEETRKTLADCGIELISYADLKQ